jgi:hypothetical protein
LNGQENKVEHGGRAERINKTHLNVVYIHTHKKWQTQLC